MTDNLRIWNDLGRTDPEHTKKFDRAGGFRGTAIKPIWTIKRMTERFGPAGIGWGTTEPVFRVERVGGPTTESVLVFCTIGVWYMDGSERSSPIYGTGGDNLQLTRKDGPKPNDEAFKAAQTDALGNALKLLGVAADVHMGLFDDEKYVREMKKEFAEDHAPATPPQARQGAEQANGAGSFRITGLSKDAGAAGWLTAFEHLLRKARSQDELNAIVADNTEAWTRLPGEYPELGARGKKLFNERWDALSPVRAG